MNETPPWKRLRACANVEPAERAAAEVQLAAAEVAVDAGSDQADALCGLIVQGNQTLVRWDARYTAFTDADAETKRIAAGRLRNAALADARWKALIESKMRETRAKVAETQTQLYRADPTPTTIGYVQAALAARRDASLATEQLQIALETIVRHLDRWVAGLETERTRRGLQARLIDGWLVLRDGARAMEFGAARRRGHDDR